MIVVDTTVWVDFFNDREEPHVVELALLIESDAGIVLTDVVLTEILQGIKQTVSCVRSRNGSTSSTCFVSMVSTISGERLRCTVPHGGAVSPFAGRLIA